MTNVSATEGGIGSLATSAVPILPKTRSPSGNCLRRRSSCTCMPTAWSRPAPGMRIACSAMSPSSRPGMNSAPRREASNAQARTSAAAPPTTSHGSLRAPRNRGSYARRRNATIGFSFSETQSRKRCTASAFTATGTPHRPRAVQRSHIRPASSVALRCRVSLAQSAPGSRQLLQS
jgi:hypothetical protein